MLTFNDDPHIYYTCESLLLCATASPPGDPIRFDTGHRILGDVLTLVKSNTLTLKFYYQTKNCIHFLLYEKNTWKINDTTSVNFLYPNKKMGQRISRSFHALIPKKDSDRD